MNTHIRKLAKQSGIWFVTPREDLLNDFAELIVRECCDVLHDNEMGGYQVNYVLKEHFGVDQ